MKLASRNRAVFVSCAALAAGMVGAAYAAVPLYYLFCRATGYGGTPIRATVAPETVSDRQMIVRFDTNIDAKLPWAFQPEQNSVKVKVGENKLVFFHAQNLSDRAIVGHATYNVEPENVAQYFDKIQCFCFTEQTLQPGESVDMPVSFFVSPAILKDHRVDNVTDITLSYSFYPAANQSAAKTAAVPVKGRGG